MLLIVFPTAADPACRARSRKSNGFVFLGGAAAATATASLDAGGGATDKRALLLLDVVTPVVVAVAVLALSDGCGGVALLSEPPNPARPTRLASNSTNTASGRTSLTSSPARVADSEEM